MTAPQPLAARVAALEADVYRMHATLDSVSGDVRAVVSEVGPLTGGTPRLERIEDRLATIETDVAEIKGRLGAIDGRIGGVEGRLGGVEAGLNVLLTHFGLGRIDPTE